jgi:hypothetical protein
MTRKFVQNIKNEDLMDFVKEAKDILDAQYEKQIREYVELLIKTGVLVKEQNEELLAEGRLTRKHFQLAADSIKAISDTKKRAEMAQHHADVFSKSNPRFDRQRFFQAAGVEDVHSAGLTDDEKFGVRRYNPKLMN